MNCVIKAFIGYSTNTREFVGRIPFAHSQAMLSLLSKEETCVTTAPDLLQRYT